jgi:amino acid transporter
MALRPPPPSTSNHGRRQEPDAPLRRGLRRGDLVALVINSVVGAGIFGLPSQVYALAGTYSLAAYAVAAVAIGLVVLCFAEVGSRFGATGGPYVPASHSDH